MAAFDFTADDSYVCPIDVNALLDAAMADTTDGEYRAAVGWNEASEAERVALEVLRKCQLDRMTEADMQAWNHAFQTTPWDSDKVRELFWLADCATEKTEVCYAA